MPDDTRKIIAANPPRGTKPTTEVGKQIAADIDRVGKLSPCADCEAWKREYNDLVNRVPPYVLAEINKGAMPHTSELRAEYQELYAKAERERIAAMLENYRTIDSELADYARHFAFVIREDRP